MNKLNPKTLRLSALFALILSLFAVSCKKDTYVETKGVCPIVISTIPLNNATGVPLNQIVSATFNEKMNPATITQSSFILRGANPVAGALTYDEATNTLSFKPTDPLAVNTTYVAKITTAVKDLNGNALQEDYVWSFSTGVVLAPMVLSTDPDNLEQGVALNKVIRATFNMPMDSLTINTTTFTLKEGVNVITGSVKLIGNSAYFTPNLPLLSNTLYTGTITTGAKNTNGVALLANHVWTFRTGVLLAPTVISTIPFDTETGVALNQTISATFSEVMDSTTINTSSFKLEEGANTIVGTVLYSGLTATFTPNLNLLPNTLYKATITTIAKNLAGTSLATDYIWTFTTAASNPPRVVSTSPDSLETGVALNKVITATFNMAMDPLTISDLTFTLKLGTTIIPGQVNYSGLTASFDPDANLLSGNTYTATITTGAKNPAGVALANDYVWTFSTADPLGPISPVLKTVARFGIIAGVGVSNNAGFSVINNMDVGIYPGFRSSITGFPPATIVNGALYAADDAAPIPAMLLQAKDDLTAAYLYCENATSPAPTTVSGDQGGKTLAPGIYKSTSVLSVQNGDLTLDAQGDVNAVWIFQIASAFTTVGSGPFPSSAGGNIILSGGAQAKNIYWQVGSSATIGDYTSFYGNVLALTSITMNAYAQAVGRMLCSNGSVVMTSTNIISKP